MKILVLAFTVPYPPDGGGRADVWRRIEAFHRLGHSVMLVSVLHRNARVLSEAQLAEMDAVLAARQFFAIEYGPVGTVRRLAGMRRLPWHAATHVPTGGVRESIDKAVRHFGPDLVWLEGPTFGELGTSYASQFRIPLYYRSHNVEFQYLKRQAAAARRLRDRVAWRLACVGLERYEEGLIRRADRVFDISLDDMALWRERGIDTVSWLPPLSGRALHPEAPEHTVPADILFVGNLLAPNNQQGLRWLTDEVLPLVRRERFPDIKLSVVGSRAPADFRAALECRPDLVCHFDVDDVTPHLFGARVLVNPVSVGSGVQLKSLDMLMTDAPIVTRSQGTRGLPKDCVDQFEIAESSVEFADRIVACLKDPHIDLESRRSIRKLFTLDAVETALSAT